MRKDGEDSKQPTLVLASSIKAMLWPAALSLATEDHQDKCGDR